MATIVRERESGRTLEAIASRLNADHVPTAQGGARWYKSTIRAVIEVAKTRSREGLDQTSIGAAGNPRFGDRLVGRRTELHEIEDAVHTSRMITLTGMAGVGKTRLALEVAARAKHLYPDGVWIVELATVAVTEDVRSAVAKAVRLWDSPGTSTDDPLVLHLRRRRGLLILDNCEHLAVACAELATVLLRGCAGLEMLVTSQMPLGISEETCRPILPLSVPDDDSIATMSSSEAVELFCDRASTRTRSFMLTPQTAPPVAAICRRLEGIPLAIELAAARLSVLSPRQVETRLDDMFALFGTDEGIAPNRSNALRVALDWSHELLSLPEQTLLRRLSVFRGTFSTDAAEAICGEDGGGSAGFIGLLSSLISKSLVLADTEGPEARYRLLEPVRAYAEGRLTASGEASPLGARHAELFLAVAEQAEPGLTGERQERSLERLDAERDNLRAALTCALDMRLPGLALGLSSSLTMYWRIRGHYREGRRWADSALSIDVSREPELRAKVLWGAGFMSVMLDDPARATGYLDECLELFRGCGDGRGEARTLLLLGNAATEPADCQRALGLLAQSEALARSVGDSWCLVHALGLRGQLLVGRDPTQAAPLLDECLAVARQTHDSQGLRLALIMLGELAMSGGNYAAAEELLLEALQVARRLAEPYGVAYAQISLAEALIYRHRLDSATALLREALDTHAQPDHIRARGLYLSGHAAHGQGDHATAQRLYREATSVSDDPVTVAATLRELGMLKHEAGDPAAAESLLNQSLAQGRSLGSMALIGPTLISLAAIAKSRGDLRTAASLYHETLDTQSELRWAHVLVEALEGLALCATADGNFERAARLYGTAGLLRKRGHSEVCAPASVLEALGPERFREVFLSGAALTLDQGLRYAQRGWSGSRDRPRVGWASLTPTELEVCWSVADGLTNAEIGQRLFISPRTVGAHLSHIFAKLDIKSRNQLSRELRKQEAASG